MTVEEKAESILGDFGVKLITDLRASLKEAGVTYGSGESKLAAKLDYKVIENNKLVNFKFTMPEYGEYLDKGRGKTENSEGGKVYPAILDWVKRKQIVGKYQRKELASRRVVTSRSQKKALKKIPFNQAAEELAHAITRKIHRVGYKPKPFYDRVVNDGRLDKLKKDLGELYKKEITIEINEFFNPK